MAKDRNEGDFTEKPDVPRGKIYNDHRILDPGVCAKHNKADLDSGRPIHIDDPFCFHCHMIAARMAHADHDKNHRSHIDEIAELTRRIARLEMLVEEKPLAEDDPNV